MKRWIFLATALIALSAQAAETAWVHDTYRPGDFILARGGRVAPVFVAAGDFACVRLAANLFAGDVESVTGHRPAVMTGAADLRVPAVIVGTLGKNPAIDRLAADGELDAEKIRGRWETFLIATVDGSLVIAGSDRRGTAFGVFELSRAIGVSPWNWWADVAPAHRDQVCVAAGTRKFGPPSVKYRGIFVNDEDWSLEPWAAKTFEPKTGNIGPKTYARICELLLRLKANTLWPAMHECSTPFNDNPANKLVADRYGIVMGSSHCEPLLRNNVGEWPRDNQAAYNFLTNPGGVARYWAERLRTNGKYENLYTIGMRGIHDGPMEGPRGHTQIVATLEKIFGVQRALLARYVNPDPTKVPQVFCAYKEVLDYYLSDLRVPPDVTVMFPDDNFGYIRYFPTPEQIAARPGGFGVYYHVSYLGDPLSHVWLDSTPPALIWEEMSKAYDHGIRKIWMLNVGGLKPRETSIDFFMQMAWDVDKWNLRTLPNYLASFAAEQFGPAHAQEIAAMMKVYYRLGYQRRPEQLQWYFGGERPHPSAFAYADYGNEGEERLAQYRTIARRARTVAAEMPANKRNAFYELVEYPILAAAAANQRLVADEMAALALRQRRADVGDWIGVFDAGTAALIAAVDRYNRDLAGGKWNHFIEDDPLMADRSFRNAVLRLPPDVVHSVPSTTPGIGVAIEGRTDALKPGETAALPIFHPWQKGGRFLDVFETGSTASAWTIRADRDWIELLREDPFPADISQPRPPTRLLPEREARLARSFKFIVRIDWARAPRGKDASGAVVISNGRRAFTVEVPVDNPAQAQLGQLSGKFVESNGVISILARDFSRKTDRPGAAWQVVPGLGRTADAVAVFPTTAASVDPSRASASAPALQYDLYLFHAGAATIHYNLIPTQPLKYGAGLRFAVAVDGAPPRLVTVRAGTAGEVGVSRAWDENVLNDTTTATTRQVFGTAGAHTLKIYMVDPGVALEKIVIDFGGLRPSYLGPPETLVSAR
jgi:Glycosyl hydrolase family 115/Gylcosyl hydrolase family 115 C-terminal domain